MGIFSRLFNRNLSVERLKKISDAKRKKDWKSILESIGKHAIKTAESGGVRIVVRSNSFMCDYNKGRQLMDILNDFKAYFNNCRCKLDQNMNNEVLIIVDWSEGNI